MNELCLGLAQSPQRPLQLGILLFDLRTLDDTRIHLGNASVLAAQPEFESGERLKGLIELTERRDVEAFSRDVTMQRELGVPVELLMPDAIPGVVPGIELRLDDVLAASYCGADGVSDPAGVTDGYRGQALRRGVSVETGCDVVGIDVEGERVTGVRLGDGRRLASPLV